MSNYYRTAFEVDGSFYAAPKSFNAFDTEQAPFLAGGGVPINWVELDSDEDEEAAHRVLALRLYLDDWQTPITSYKETELTVGEVSWLVMNDIEADAALETELNHQVDDVLEFPSHLQTYFDEEKWKDDARELGRGAWLSRNCASERKVDTDSYTFYIFCQG